MGRPKKPGALEEVLKIRVSTDLLTAVDQARGALSRSDWCRRAIVTAYDGAKTVLVTGGKTHTHRRVETSRSGITGRETITYECGDPGCTWQKVEGP